MGAFNIAIVGAGGISKAHIEAARATNGQVKIVAVVDPAESARQAAAQATGAKAYADLDACLRDPQLSLEGLVVCTPPSVRLPIVQVALQRGLPVLVEKPLAHKLADVRQLAQMATERSAVATAVAYCHRFTPAIVEMRRQLASGSLGQPLRFENVFACWHPTMQHGWMSDPAVSGGGSLIDTGSHSFDLYLHLFGKSDVTSCALHRAWPGRGESSATVTVLGHDSRVTGFIASGWQEPARFTVTVVGTRGLLSYDFDRPTELLYRPSEGPDQRLTVESHEVRFRDQLLAFAQFARNPSQRGSLCSFAEALAVAELVDSAYRIGYII